MRLMKKNNTLFYCLGVIILFVLVVSRKSGKEEGKDKSLKSDDEINHMKDSDTKTYDDLVKDNEKNDTPLPMPAPPPTYDNSKNDETKKDEKKDETKKDNPTTIIAMPRPTPYTR